MQKEFAFIKTVVLRAVEEGVLATNKNPCNRIKLHEGRARGKATLSANEVARLKALTPSSSRPAGW